MNNTNIMFIKKIGSAIVIKKIRSLCYDCNKPIYGKAKEKNMAVCHPAMSYDTVKVCKNCYSK